MNDARRLLDEFEEVKDIGSGAFGRVVKIRRKRDGVLFVWKELSYVRMSDDEKRMMVSEVNILRQFSHPHIVRYEDRIVDRSKKRIYIIMEYCAGGDLAKLILQKEEEDCRLEEAFVWKVLSGISSALSVCHKTSRDPDKILHRDLKPGNIFFDENFSAKLGDFGLSRKLSHNTVFARTHVGTPYYMSPEQVAQENYDEKSDIWSLGCILYEMCTFSPPFDAENQLALAEKIRFGEFKPIPERFGYSKDLLNLIYSMLQVSPGLRPGVEDILQVRQVAFGLRDEQLTRRYLALKKAEEEAAQTKARLAEKLESLLQREIEITHQTGRLLEKEKALVRREEQINRREEFGEPRLCENCRISLLDLNDDEIEFCSSSSDSSFEVPGSGSRNGSRNVNVSGDDVNNANNHNPFDSSSRHLHFRPNSLPSALLSPPNSPPNRQLDFHDAAAAHPIGHNIQSSSSPSIFHHSHSPELGHTVNPNPFKPSPYGTSHPERRPMYAGEEGYVYDSPSQSDYRSSPSPFSAGDQNKDFVSSVRTVIEGGEAGEVVIGGVGGGCCGEEDEGFQSQSHANFRTPKPRKSLAYRDVADAGGVADKPKMRCDLKSVQERFHTLARDYPSRYTTRTVSATPFLISSKPHLPTLCKSEPRNRYYSTRRPSSPSNFGSEVRTRLDFDQNQPGGGGGRRQLHRHIPSSQPRLRRAQTDVSRQVAAEERNRRMHERSRSAGANLLRIYESD